MPGPGNALRVLLALAAASAPFPGFAQDHDRSRVREPAPFAQLRSVRLDLPQGDQMFPPGPGVEALNNNCLACHSADMVLYQPAMPRATWEAEVNKMINTYKAPVAAEDVPAIVAYLDATKGLDVAKSAPPRQAPPREGTSQAR